MIKPRKYKRLHKLNRWLAPRGGRKAFLSEIQSRMSGLSITFEPSFMAASNPLSSWDAADFVQQRYHAALRYLDAHPAQSILEIGHGGGLTSWLLTDVATDVTALDIDETRHKIAAHLFPEVEFHLADYRDYLATGDKHYDLIIASFAPIEDADFVLRHCDRFIKIGQVPKSWSELFSFKLKGRQLSFSTTLAGDGFSGIDLRYPLYYFDRVFMAEFKRNVRVHGVPLL